MTHENSLSAEKITVDEKEKPKFRVVKSSARGQSSDGISWLEARYIYSFAEFYNPEQVSFKSLRVFNDDLIKPQSGFDEHFHANFEILSYVLEGELSHKDSLGNTYSIKQNELQLISAGKGIKHSEHNLSEQQRVRLLQIWFYPDQKAYEPRYQQETFQDADKENKLKLLVQPENFTKNILEESEITNLLKIRQNLFFYASLLDNRKTIDFEARYYNNIFVYVISGRLELLNLKNDSKEKTLNLNRGDSLELENLQKLSLKALEDSHFILIELDNFHKIVN